MRWVGGWIIGPLRCREGNQDAWVLVPALSETTCFLQQVTWLFCAFVSLPVNGTPPLWAGEGYDRVHSIFIGKMLSENKQ